MLGFSMYRAMSGKAVFRTCASRIGTPVYLGAPTLGLLRALARKEKRPSAITLA